MEFFRHKDLSYSRSESGLPLLIMLNASVIRSAIARASNHSITGAIIIMIKRSQTRFASKEHVQLRRQIAMSYYPRIVLQ